MIRVIALLILWLTALSGAVDAAPSPPPEDLHGPPTRRALVLETIEIHGLEGTSKSSVLNALSLSTGTEVDQSMLVDAIASLESEQLVAGIEYFTRPGSERGQIVLVLELDDKKPRTNSMTMSMGAGNSDSDGWYWIPIHLDLDNVLHKNAGLHARIALGYRFSEFSTSYRRKFGPQNHSWWGLTAATRSTERYYVLEGLEVSHGVGRDYAGFDFGHHLTQRWTLTTQLRNEIVKPKDHAKYPGESDFHGIEQNQNIPLEDLPQSIQDAVGQSERIVFDGLLSYDSLSQHEIAFSPTGGLWAGLRYRSTIDGGTSTPFVSLDLKTHVPLLGGVMSWRARGAYTGDDAPFYDRLYLGGLYTVRGVPSHGLTDPGGGTWLWNSSLEFRAPLSGDPEDPGLAGSLFVDVGQSDAAINPHGHDLAASLGWGLRWRLFGIVMGPDMAVPITGSPVDELFHGNFTIGWSF